MELNIVGLKLHHYIGKKIKGHNCKFESYDADLIKYIVCLKDHDNIRYELELYQDYGECYSGWTTATWGRFNFKKVDNFGAITHYPKKDSDTKIIFDPDDKKNETDKDDYVYDNYVYRCDWFSYSETGGDDYYPSGFVKVKMDNFETTQRGFDEHPTWIFHGASNLGKSFLAHQIKEMTIFETDAYDELPDKINADIIVLGNKHKYTLENIKERVNGKAILVNFMEI